MNNGVTVKDVSGPLGPEEFLELAGDEDVIRFFQRLPMVAGQADGTVTMSDLVFEIELWPFVKVAWKDTKGTPGIAGRLKQVAEVYKKAETDLERETGKKRRLERIIDVPTFTEIYTTGGLP